MKHIKLFENFDSENVILDVEDITKNGESVLYIQDETDVYFGIVDSGNPDLKKLESFIKSIGEPHSFTLKIDVIDKPNIAYIALDHNGEIKSFGPDQKGKIEAETYLSPDKKESMGGYEQDIEGKVYALCMALSREGISYFHSLHHGGYFEKVYTIQELMEFFETTYND